MTQREDNWPTVPRHELYPEIAAVLEPGEDVYWQGKPAPPPVIFNTVAVLLLLGLMVWAGDLAAPLSAIWQSYSLVELLPFLVIPVAFIGLLIVVPRHKANLFRYALTSQRALSLRRGEINQQAGPEALHLLDVVSGDGDTGFVRWRSAGEPLSESRNRGFHRVPRAREVHQLLQDWQQSWQVRSDTRAETSSAAFRQVRDSGSPENAAAATAAIDDTGTAVQRIIHPQYGFSLAVPAEWDITVAQNYDGPWRVLGFTLLKRIIRPGTPRPYSPDDRAPWNKLTIRGGASTGLNINIHPPESATRIPDEEEVLNDRWGKTSGIPVKFFEKDIAIAGFEGHAVVRDLPAGSNTAGFGQLPVAVLSRQWWLRGHGLYLEIFGIAPADSAVLQETIDRVVQSLQQG